MNFFDVSPTDITLVFLHARKSCFFFLKIIFNNVYLFLCLQAFSQHAVLSFSFLEHVVLVLNQIPYVKGDSDGADSSSHSFDSPVEENVLQAAVLALTALFKYQIIHSNCRLFN